MAFSQERRIVTAIPAYRARSLSFVVTRLAQYLL